MKLLPLLACLLLSHFVKAQSPSVDSFVKQGIDLTDRGYYEEALLKYDSAINLDNKSLMANYEKAYTLMHMMRYDDVLTVCKGMLKNNKGNKALSEVYIMQGNALDMLLKRRESVKAYDEGIKDFPDNSLLYYNKGVTLFALNENKEALEATKWAVIKNPHHASSHNTIASVYQRSNRTLSLMAALSFLAIEPQGERAVGNLKKVKAFLTESAKKTGDNAYSIDLDASMLLNDKNTEDNFATTDMLMSLGMALNVEDKYKEETIADRLARNLNTVISSLKELQERGKGFGWDFYVPFFVALQKDGQVEALSHIIFASADDLQNNTWLSANKDKVTAFYKWLNAYKWPSPKL